MAGAAVAAVAVTVTAVWAAAAAAWVAEAVAANVPARLASRGGGGSSPLVAIHSSPS